MSHLVFLSHLDFSSFCFITRGSRAWGTALCMQMFSVIGARRRDFELLKVSEFSLLYPRSKRPETMLDRRAWGTALCIQQSSFIPSSKLFKLHNDRTNLGPKSSTTTGPQPQGLGASIGGGWGGTHDPGPFITLSFILTTRLIDLACIYITFI